MHSKWQLWDFFNSVKRDYLAEKTGVIALSTFDPICLKLVKDYLVRGAGERTIHYRMAPEVTRDWIEEEFQSLSLFGAMESFFIHQAQDLKAEQLEALASLDLSDRFVILSFESENAGWKKLVKEGKIDFLQIEAPKFWEPHKLLDFVNTYLRLPLTFESKAWMLDSLENNLSSFYHASCLLKLNFPEAKEVNLTQVKSLLETERLDQFVLASLLARKKNAEFFGKLLHFETDFERMRGLFNFMQSHLIKIMDPSYLDNKPRLSGYDKDIQSASKLWKTEDLKKEVERFNRWELMSKKKDSLLWHELKASFLQSF
jgi:hypothetical protein